MDTWTNAKSCNKLRERERERERDCGSTEHYLLTWCPGDTKYGDGVTLWVVLDDDQNKLSSGRRLGED